VRWRQLSNKDVSRPALSYGYFALVATLVVILNVSSRSYSAGHPDQVPVVIYLAAAVAVLSFVDVRLDRGRLTLSGLALGAAAVLLNPLDATIVGLSIGAGMARRGAWPIIGNAVITAAFACIGAIVAMQLRSITPLPLWARMVVILTTTIGSLALVAVGLSMRTGESVVSIVRRNFNASFYVALGYFALGSLVITYVLNGSPIGFLLASITCVLALALTDTIAGRRIRRVLESELSDADRHLFHSRAVEGVVHNLRNHMATAVGYLREIDLNRLEPVDRSAIETAAAAAGDAVTVLRTLSQGATPRVSYSPEPVDLNAVATRALDMARPRARAKEIELGLRESQEEVKVRADPLLLREVITNLVNNAIDAAPTKGRVNITTGRRTHGSPFVTVADNGPGVSDENRHHLFEPHFTTKENGTGLGLFMSYGVIREHQGQLLFEGNRHGAVFTVILPPFERSVSRG
jgi:signal transduction histidine kinase